MPLAPALRDRCIGPFAGDPAQVLGVKKRSRANANRPAEVGARAPFGGARSLTTWDPILTSSIVASCVW